MITESRKTGSTIGIVQQQKRLLGNYEVQFFLSIQFKFAKTLTNYHSKRETSKRLERNIYG